jgi:hypothetical protein
MQIFVVNLNGTGFHQTKNAIINYYSVDNSYLVYFGVQNLISPQSYAIYCYKLQVYV